MEHIAKALLSTGAIRFNANKPFTFASGKISPIYCDNRLLISWPTQRKLICEEFHRLCKQLTTQPKIIAGTATAGIPHAAWLADRTDLPMVYVRSSEKKHGTNRLVEGVIHPGDTAVLIEDLVTTGGSSLKAVQALREQEASVSDVLCIFSYGFDEAIQAFKNSGCHLHSLTNLETLLKVASTMNLLNQEELGIINHWKETGNILGS
jgi:orotate phosphoribosyltransferase